MPDPIDMENFDPTNVDFEKQKLMNENLGLRGALTSAGLNDPQEQNIFHEKLETSSILERIEHFLRGDQIRITEEGSYYAPPTKNIITIVKQDPTTKIKYFIEEFKEVKKGTETIRKVLVRIESGKENEYIDVLLEDSKKILEKIEKIKLKDSGYKYIEVVDESKKPLNEYGVSELMRIISMYVTKETFLSYYTEDRINEILGDLGIALTKFLFCNYDQMGMDTKFKESKYILIVLNILHTIESCYRRALHGSEQRHMNTKALVTQNTGGGVSSPQGIVKPKWNPFKPTTW